MSGTERLAQEINDKKVNIDTKTFNKTTEEKELLKKMKASYKKTIKENELQKELLIKKLLSND